jgi:hypothetical protein
MFYSVNEGYIAIRMFGSVKEGYRVRFEVLMAVKMSSQQTQKAGISNLIGC